MAYEYRVPGLRFDMAGKAIADALFREAQLEAKRQNDFQNTIDREYRLYNGKVRKQDAAIFDSAFQEYQDIAKAYNSVNRRGGKKIQEISRQLDEKRRAVLDIVDESAKWGGKGIDLEKARKDSKMFINKSKYQEYMNDLYTMDRNQLNAKYNGIQNSPKLSDFELKKGNISLSDYAKINNFIQKTNLITPSNTIKAIPSMDDNGRQKERQMTLRFGDEELPVQVPLKKIVIGPDPIGLYNSVKILGMRDDIKEIYNVLLDDVLKNAANSQNPGEQDIAIKSLSKVSQMFGVPRDQITPEMYYASTFVTPDMTGTLEIEDWDTFNDKIGVIQKDLAIKGKKVDIAKAVQDLIDSTSPLGELNKGLSILSKIESTGAMNQDDMKESIKNAFKTSKLKWNITDKTFDELWKGSFQSKLARRTGEFISIPLEEIR